MEQRSSSGRSLFKIKKDRRNSRANPLDRQHLLREARIPYSGRRNTHRRNSADARSLQLTLGGTRTCPESDRTTDSVVRYCTLCRVACTLRTQPFVNTSAFVGNNSRYVQFAVADRVRPAVVRAARTSAQLGRK